MIDSITKTDLHKLLATADGPCLSIYMPTPHAGLDSFQNSTRLKSLLAEAEKRLSERLGTAAVDAFLQPVRELVDDDSFWQTMSDGLVLFRSSQALRTWRLPRTFGNYVSVGERFYFKPLLPLIGSDGPYYLLAVSQNEVRLLTGSRWHLSESHLDSLPASLVEALNYHRPEGLCEVRTGNRSLPGKEGGVFHGQGASTQHAKEDQLAYFRVIDRALHDFLRPGNAPLVFAGVGYLFPIYCHANTYPHLWKEPLAGNPQGVHAAELHRRATELLEPYWSRESNLDLERFRQALGSDRASSDLEEILRAAQEGRMEVLLLTLDASRWGRFDETSGHVEFTAAQRPGSEELLDLAAFATLSHGGRVQIVKPADLGDGRPASALLRYGAPKSVAATANE